MTTLERAIEVYGKDMQLNVAIEELSELIKEICKHKRGVDNREAIIEEVVDCYIMLEQIEIIFEVTEFEYWREKTKKLTRLEKRLSELDMMSKAEDNTIKELNLDLLTGIFTGGLSKYGK